MTDRREELPGRLFGQSAFGGLQAARLSACVFSGAGKAGA